METEPSQDNRTLLSKPLIRWDEME